MNDSKTLGWTITMGPRLRAEVTHQLIEDLKYYGCNEENISLDWSETCIEGRNADWLDGSLDCYSGIRIKDGAGVPIGDGWMDFVVVEERRKLIIYWEFLTIRETKLKSKPGMPDHIWSRLPTEVKKINERYLVENWGKKIKPSGKDEVEDG